MPINFPDSPLLNDTYTEGGRTWVWNGSVWKAQGTVAARNNSTPYGAVDNSGLTYSVWAGMYTSSNASSGSFGVSTIYIPDWRAAHEKPVMLDSAAPKENHGSQQIGGSRWLSSSAITSVQVRPGGAHSFVQHSCISLYGVTSDTGGVTISQPEKLIQLVLVKD